MGKPELRLDAVDGIVIRFESQDLNEISNVIDGTPLKRLRIALYPNIKLTLNQKYKQLFRRLFRNLYPQFKEIYEEIPLLREVEFGDTIIIAGDLQDDRTNWVDKALSILYSNADKNKLELFDTVPNTLKFDKYFVKKVGIKTEYLVYTDRIIIDLFLEYKLIF